MSESIEDKDGGAAFPLMSEPGFPSNIGMSLRDYFAGQALPSLIAVKERLLKGNPKQYEGAEAEKVVAQAAYFQADAMLSARKVQP